MKHDVESFERAASFVRRTVYSSDPGGVGLRSQFQALLAVWLAGKAGATRAASHLEACSASTQEAIEQESRAGSFDPYQHDPKLLLLSRVAMRECGIDSPALARFSCEIAEATRMMRLIPARLSGVVLLLEVLNDLPTGTTSTIDLQLRAPDRSLLRLDPSEVRAICNQIAASSLFGLRPLPARSAARIRSQLPIMMLQRLREYDLMLGAVTIRTLKYLGAGACEEVAQAIEYLLSQQQVDGRFGFYAPELSSGMELQNADLELYLPVTVSVLWALAEVSVRGFSLVGTTCAPTRAPGRRTTPS